MANVRLQDLTAIIHNTSRSNGGKYDLVHVENLIQTDTPVESTLSWYAPAGVSPTPIASELLKSSKLAMYPRTEAELLDGTQDIIQEAQNGKASDLIDDFAKLMMLCMMKKATLTPVEGATNLYILSYDYKLFPNSTTPTNFKFSTELPFKGLTMAPNGGKVQMTVLMPLGAVIDPNATKGTAPNNPNIQEQIVNIPSINRNTVTFRYKIDPLFDIVYHY